jgi:hypothetical protein
VHFSSLFGCPFICDFFILFLNLHSLDGFNPVSLFLRSVRYNPDFPLIQIHSLDLRLVYITLVPLQCVSISMYRQSLFAFHFFKVAALLLEIGGFLP